MDNNSSYSIYWTNQPNSNGVNPPNPQFQLKETPVNISCQKTLAGTGKNDQYPVRYIYSNREPYAVDYLYTPYGQLNTKLGTDIGK